MKVLQIIQRPQLRGAEIFACQLATELIATGHQVDIAFLFPTKNLLQEAYPKLRFISLGAKRSGRFFDIGCFRRLNQIIGNYDVVQANAGDTLKYAVFSKTIFGWKQPLVFRNANKMSSFIRGKFHLLFNKFLLRVTDYIISVSENCRLDVIAIEPSAASRSKTIPIGTYSFDNVAAIPRTDKGPVIVNVSSFVPEKNHEFLIRVFQQFLSKVGDAKLWLVGDGPLRSRIDELVKTSGLSHAVVFYGFRKDAISIIKSADVMVLPSLIEGLPGVILESFACKVPVVASDVGGIPEVVVNGKTGLCLKGWSENQYVHALESLTNKDIRASIIPHALEIVKSAFSMGTIASRFKDTYQQLLH